MPLDLATVFVSYALSNAICALGMLVLWLRGRRRSADFKFWMADFFMQAVAIPFVLLRGRIPDFLSIVVPYFLIVGGTLLLYIGLERFTGKSTSQWLNWSLLAAFTGLHAYFTFGQPSLIARNINLSAGLLWISAQAAWLLLRRVDSAWRPTTRIVGVIFVLFALLSLVRILVDAAGARPASLWDMGAFDTLAILSYQILFIALAFGLLLMRIFSLVGDLEMDIAERRRAEDELRQLTTRDPLTGLHNRHFLEQQAAALEATGASPLSVLVADVDGLKETNDSLGHGAGDELLRQVSGLLKRAFRSGDVIARIGGDEFVVLLLHANSAVAQAALDRLHRILQEHNALHLESPISLSVGISTAASNEPIKQVLRRADDNMYREKRGRRIERTPA